MNEKELEHLGALVERWNHLLAQGEYLEWLRVNGAIMSWLTRFFSNKREVIIKKPRAPYSCRICKQQGHNAINCPKNPKKELEPYAGKPASAIEIPSEPDLRMNKYDYDRVKRLFDNGKKAVTIANELQMPLQHINYSILASTYEKYLEHAKRIV